MNIEAARAFRDAAVADGWSIEPTYGDGESVDRAARLMRNGFAMQVVTRPKTEQRTKDWAEVNVWGPDGLAISVPETYSYEDMVRGLRHCFYCKAYDVDTERVGFAGRACKICAPIEEKKLGKHYYD